MEVFSLKNLNLAWRRINTGTGHLYKRFFRPIYLAYEIAADENLKDLSERLKGGSYEPHKPIRFYLPKPSGLQRPITLLALEDQIVFQCIANVFAEKVRQRREKVQCNTVYSNILQPKNSIFFVKDWHISYHEFQEKISVYYKAKYRWIAHFDLAAFYDTICHELLLKVIYPRNKTELTDSMGEYLACWSSSKKSENHGHGLPQGTLASNFLAECFLLPVDESLIRDKIKYVRYCDDIRIFGKSESQVRNEIIKLEIYFRERGLIPQGSKHAICEAKSIKDALGSLPSIKDEPKRNSIKWITIPASTAYDKFRSALGGKPLRIADKSRASHVLYHASPSFKLTSLVFKLMPHHPENIDSFICYLDRCKGTNKTISHCINILNKSPYEYVQGEIWHVLAKNFNFIITKQSPSLIKRAIDIVKRNNFSLPLRWGALHFLCEAEKELSKDYSRFIKYQEPLLQGLTVQMLPDDRFVDNPIMKRLLARTSIEPSLMLAEQFVNRGLTHNSYNVKANQLPSQTQNVYRKLRLINGPKQKIDPMGEVLSKRYNIPKYNGWKKILGQEYTHALQILKQADAVYLSCRSKWLTDQNSFNHSLFAELYAILVNSNVIAIDSFIKKPEEAKTVKGYGKLLNSSKNFSKKYPIIGQALFDCNNRRNSIPLSHPYNNSGKQNKWLTANERKELTLKLKNAYTEIIDIATNSI